MLDKRVAQDKVKYFTNEGEECIWKRYHSGRAELILIICTATKMVYLWIFSGEIEQSNAQKIL